MSVKGSTLMLMCALSFVLSLCASVSAAALWWDSRMASARAIELQIEVSVMRLEQRVQADRIAVLKELVYLAEEESILLSAHLGKLDCKVDHIVSISRIGWWDKTVLDGLRRCNSKQEKKQ